MNAKRTNNEQFHYLVDSEPTRLSEEKFRQSLANKSCEELIEELSRLNKSLQLSEAKLLSVLDISSSTRDTTDYLTLLEKIIRRISELMEAERSTLYLLDEDGQHITSRILMGEQNREIRLKLGEGVAGLVAQTGSIINLKNAQKDPRFNRNIDDMTGFNTRNMLCVPVRKHTGEITGAVQVLNSNKAEGFTSEDEKLLIAIACQTGITIENQRLYQKVIKSNQKLTKAQKELEDRVLELDMLYSIEHELARAPKFSNMLRGFTGKIAHALKAKCAAVTLTVSGRRRMYMSTHVDGDWSFFLRVLRGNDISFHDEILEELKKGPVVDLERTKEFRYRYQFSFEQATNSKIEQWVGVLLTDEKEEIIGALHVLNKEDGTPFTEGEIRLLKFIAERISNSIVVRHRADKLAESERLASIGGMLAGVVHDLKGPITAVSGYIQLMEASDSRSERKKFKERCLNRLNTLTQMTRELLVFAKGEHTLSLKLVDLKAHFIELKYTLDQELREKPIILTINLDYDGDALLDPSKLDRVLLNLVRNAVDAMENATDKHPGRLTIHVYLEGDYIVFSVSDTGNGILPEIQDTLFDSFVTSGKKHGTGLGLAIVKNIVDSHQGKISFTSERDQGTTFFVKIPFSSDRSIPPF